MLLGPFLDSLVEALRDALLERFLDRKFNGGGRGIRTPVGLSTKAVFKTACFNRSHIPPRLQSVYQDPLGTIEPLSTFPIVASGGYIPRFAGCGIAGVLIVHRSRLVSIPKEPFL